MMVAAALAAVCVVLVLAAQEPARAAFPGRNGTIAFVGLNAESSNYQIFTVSPSGGNPRQLTFNAGDKESPTWSPDGRKIAFVTNRGEPHGKDIYTMKADGSEQAVLTRSPKDDFDPSWSPDGSRLVFSRQVTEAQPGVPANRELFSVRRDGTHLVRLTRTAEVSELDPAWSPDGTEIAFSTFTHDDYPGYGSIYVMKADGSEPPAVLLPYLGYVGGLGWSPDGQWLAFSSGGPHSSCITKMRADGSDQPTNLVCGDPYGCYLPDYYPSWPDWSPDGTTMVFHDSCNGLVTMDADGENLRTIYGGWADQPSWRPIVS